jgi:hypothetical protein
MITTLKIKLKIQRGSLEINGIMEDVLQYQKPAMKKKVAYSHNLIEDGKYVLLNKDGRANLLRLGEGLQSPVLIMEKHLLRHLQHVQYAE